MENYFVESQSSRLLYESGVLQKYCAYELIESHLPSLVEAHICITRVVTNGKSCRKTAICEN